MASSGGEEKKRKLDGSSEALPSLRPEEIRDLLTALRQEQVVDLLVRACSAHPDVLADVRDAASKDPATRKLFVRGLAWETTTQDLKTEYAEFGEVEEAAVIIDKQSGKSKGFGFVTFKHIDAAQKALKNPRKNIMGRWVHANLAALGSSSNQNNNDLSQRKVYVGGLSYDTSTDALLDYFSKYGEIDEGSVALDKQSGKSRGFAFITFKTPEGAQAACAEPVKLIDTRNVNVKLAVDGRQQRQQQEQVSASGLQSYSAGGMQNQGFGFGGSRPVMNQPMGGIQNMGGAAMTSMQGYANQGGMGQGQFPQLQSFAPAQQFGNVGVPHAQGQMAPQQQYTNQAGFGGNPVPVQQFVPQQQAAQQQPQFQQGQLGYVNPAQTQMVGGLQQPPGQMGNPQMMAGFQQGANTGPAPTTLAGGVPNQTYNFSQGQ